MKRARQDEQLPVEPDLEDGFEIWEPKPVDPIRTSGPFSHRLRLSTSVPGAVAGAFLVCALAFGAAFQVTGAGSGEADRTDAATAGLAGDALNGDIDVADHDGGDKTSPDGEEEPNDETTAGESDPGVPTTPDGEPAPGGDAPNGEPAPDQTPLKIDLDLRLGDGGRVRLDWGECPVDGFTVWKVVRSTDAGATFPLGEHDVLVAAIADQSRTATTDTGAPQGRKLWYVVIGLAGEGDARHVACVSPVRAVTTPASEPDPKPTGDPGSTETPVLSLALSIREGAVFIDFGACTVDGAEVYKVVRSTDSTVKWPAGEGDTLVAAIGIDGKTAAWDEHAPAGKKVWYRVFCVRHSEDGYRVLAASAVRGITTPAGDTVPDPKSMWIAVEAVDGHVVVHWEGCGGEAFSHYRIVRKTGDSSSVVAEIENAGTTTWVDSSVEPGVTYKYLVQAKGVIGGSYVLLGSTDWATVTVS